MEALTREIQPEFLGRSSSTRPQGHLEHNLKKLVAGLSLCLECATVGVSSTQRASGNNLYVRAAKECLKVQLLTPGLAAEHKGPGTAFNGTAWGRGRERKPGRSCSYPHDRQALKG